MMRMRMGRDVASVGPGRGGTGVAIARDIIRETLTLVETRTEGTVAERGRVMTTNANAPARQRLTMRQRTLALIVAVLASAGPAIAQEGPSLAVEPAGSGLQQPRAYWSRVRKLAAAT